MNIQKTALVCSACWEETGLISYMRQPCIKWLFSQARTGTGTKGEKDDVDDNYTCGYDMLIISKKNKYTVVSFAQPVCERYSRWFNSLLDSFDALPSNAPNILWMDP